MDFKKVSLSYPCQVGILLVSDSDIKKLNKLYRGKNKTTDVLSFSMIEGGLLLKESPILGEIVISLDTTIRQAKEYDVNPYQELLRLLIHGLLHLAGYDHEGVSKKAATEMKSLEERIYRRYLKEAASLI